MTFFTVVIRSLVRRPVRTSLTLLGISTGIAAVVALVGISGGFEKSWETGMKARGTDIVVSNMTNALTPKPFDAAVQQKVDQVAGVGQTSALLVDLMSVESAQMMMVSSRQWGAFTWQSLKIVEGRLPTDADEKAALLGTTAAEVLGKKIGDPLQIDTEEVTVVGIVDGGAWVENGSVILSLELYQSITGNEGKINVIDIRVKSGEDASKVCEQINAAVPDAKAVAAGDHIRQSQSYKIVQAISWGTSLLAIFVGVLGVMNTMLMTVFERTQELCVLLALGWRRARVMSLILWESALLGLLGGVFGVALGILGVKLLEMTPTVRGLLEPDLSWQLFVIAVAMAIGVGVLSGLYPAWRSSRLAPSRAMQGG